MCGREVAKRTGEHGRAAPKIAQPAPGYEAKVKMAERRLAVLLRVYRGFKDDPDFIAAYRREMSALGGEVEPAASE